MFVRATVITCVALFMLAAVTELHAQDRIRYYYDTPNGKGYFENTVGTTWIDVKAGVYLGDAEETARTEDFVEIHGKTGLYLRFYNDKVYWRQDYGKKWVLWGKGRWN